MGSPNTTRRNAPVAAATKASQHDRPAMNALLRRTRLRILLLRILAGRPPGVQHIRRTVKHKRVTALRKDAATIPVETPSD